MKTSLVSWFVLAVQVLIVLLTTLGIVNVTYNTRTKFSELERLRSQYQLQLEDWGRLILEESAFSSPSRVERVAREDLKMVLPDNASTLELE